MAQSMREALEKAFEKHDETEVETPEIEAAPEVEADLAPPAAEGEEAAPEVEAAPEHEEQPQGRERAADGKFAKKADAAVEQKPIAKAAAAAAEAAEEPPKPAGEALKAPSSLKAAAREAFTKAPRELQEDVIRIDKEVRQVMQQSADARRFEGAFREMITPYVGMIRAETRGRPFNPLEAISAVMDTAVALRTGQPGAKADMIGEMVSTYGVPADQLIAKILKSYRGDMKQLDESISRLMEGHAPTPGAQPQPQDFRDPRLDQYLQEREHERETQRAELFAEKKSEVEAFAAKNEWYEDVRADMARLFAVAKEANEPITLQEAYDTALSLPKHKGIQTILGQRSQAAAIAAKKKAAVKARNAGSSVRGSPTGTATPEPATNSRRASIEAAMSENDR